MALKRPKQPGNQKSNLLRSVLFWATILFLGLFVFSVFYQQSSIPVKPVSDVFARANDGKIEKLIVEGRDVFVVGKNDTETSQATERALVGEGSIYDQGLNKDAPVQVEFRKPSEAGNNFMTLLSILLPVLLIGGLFFFMFRQAQGQSNQAMGFGKSRARMLTEK